MMDTRVMPVECTTPDLVELVLAYVEAWNRRDLDAAIGPFASDPVWDASQTGVGTFEGVAAIRSFVNQEIDEARADAERLAEERG